MDDAPASDASRTVAPAQTVTRVQGTRRGFSLTKWYLDLVTDEGTTLVCYAASVGWRDFHLELASVMLSRADAPAEEQRVWSDVRMPCLEQGAVRFADERLRLTGEWRNGAAPLEATLLDDAAGSLHWHCVLPNAFAAVEACGEALVGRGYVECLTMTRLPRLLPLRRLAWGRYTSRAHSAVWIGWSGEAPRQWVWLDGLQQPGVVLHDDGSSTAAHWAIRAIPERTLCDRQALRIIAPSLGPVLPLFGRLGELREVKRVDRGLLSCNDVQVDEGWLVHEVVTW